MSELKVSSKAGKVLAIIGIIFVALNAVIFALFGFTDHGVGFWSSYIFFLISFAVVLTSFALLKNRSVQPRDWLLGYPIMSHCVIYLVAETVACILFMVLDGMDIPWAIGFVVQILILAVHLVLNISCFLSKQIIEEVEHKVAVNSKRIKVFQIDVEMIAEKSVNPEIKKAYAALAERIRYSDPMSSDFIKDLEDELEYVIGQAKHAVAINDDQNAMILCNKADLILTERNKKCMISK